MARTQTIHINILLGATVILGVLSLLLAGATLLNFSADQTILGRLLPASQRIETPWKIISAKQLETGLAAPPDTNVLLIMPSVFQHLNTAGNVTDQSSTILRTTLFGLTSETIRYWGYCIPPDYDRNSALQSDELPGKVFLSQAERDARKQQYFDDVHNRFSPTQNLDEKRLNDIYPPQNGIIQHEIDVIEANSMCFLMTSHPLPVGLDPDDDTVNEELERQFQSNPLLPDTDNDGLPDGRELAMGTSPTLRDSDNDSLPDGLEDRNRNGRIDHGETSPLKLDSDGDGLPDGGVLKRAVGLTWLTWKMCKSLHEDRLDELTKQALVLRSQSGSTTLLEREFPGCTISGSTLVDCPSIVSSRCDSIDLTTEPKDSNVWGEDLNNNGTVEQGETDPTLWSTFDDGISDGTKYYQNCLKLKLQC